LATWKPREKKKEKEKEKNRLPGNFIKLFLDTAPGALSNREGEKEGKRGWGKKRKKKKKCILSSPV